MFKAILIAAAISTTAIAAHASDRSAKTETAVSTRGVNFNDPSQVRAFHDELARTATTVCDSGVDRQLSFEMSDRACAKAALDRAVAQIAQPMLTAYHKGQPITAPKTLLASR